MDNLIIDYIFKGLFIIVMSAITYIFTSFNKRLGKLEKDKPCVALLNLTTKVEDNEEKLDRINPLFTEIKERLARIEVNLEYLKKNK